MHINATRKLRKTFSFRRESSYVCSCFYLSNTKNRPNKSVNGHQKKDEEK